MPAVRTIDDVQWRIPTPGDFIGQGTFDKTTITPTNPLLSGTVLARRTSDGLLVRYDNNSQVPGVGVAIGISNVGIRVSATTDIDDVDATIDYTYHGIAIESRLTGLDADAKTDLKLMAFV